MKPIDTERLNYMKRLYMAEPHAFVPLGITCLWCGNMPGHQFHGTVRERRAASAGTGLREKKRRRDDDDCR